MIPSAIGFNNLAGMLTNRSVPDAPHMAAPRDGQVLAAFSAGVSKALAAADTAGLLLGLISIKFPPKIREVGIVPLRRVAVPKSQRRS
jgi:hypothetical protein